MNFEDFLKVNAKKINQQLNNDLKIWSQKVSKISKDFYPLIKLFIDASTGGKRIRGALVILGYQIAGAKINQEILKVASAYEIFQTAILIHDDIIDKALLRRGQKTIHTILKGEYGKNQAISLGDMGFFLSMQLISKINFPLDLKMKALNFFSKTMLDTSLGEILDVKGSNPITISKLKTASYSISGPLILGAILGLSSRHSEEHEDVESLDEKLISNLKIFGENLGIAFQIQDDILGVFGNKKDTKKSITSDIEQGKSTLLIEHAKKFASKKDRKILETLYGKGTLTQKQINQLKVIFKNSGALDYSRTQALKYKASAKKIISKITPEKNYQTILEQLTDYLVNN